MPTRETQAQRRVTRDDHESLVATLAHHDAAIMNLTHTVRATSEGLAALTSNVNTGFAALGSKFDKLDNRPAFDFFKTTGLILQLAILLSMMVAGIIYVTGGQFAGVWAEQRMFNAAANERLKKVEDRVETGLARLADRQWQTRTEPLNAPPRP